MPFEFGFDVIRIDVDELETEQDEPREFVIEALAGDVAAHISTDVAGLTRVLDEIAHEEHNPGFRAGGAWEPQLPQMRGFFFHPRVVLGAVEVIAPHLDPDDEPVDYWEFIVDDDEGSQVVLRMSETTTRQLVRLIRELIDDVIA